MDELEIDREALLATFGEEARELLDDMERRLLAMESAPGDQETLHALFRAAHTLKGGAALTGLDEVRFVTHAAEDLLERWRDGKIAASPAVVTLLLKVVDALRAGVAAGVAGRPADGRTLRELRDRLSAAAALPAEEGAKPASAPAPSQGTGAPRTLRVDVGKLDRMLDLTGELAIARGRLGEMLERGGEFSGEVLLEAHREADRLFLDLQELVMKARMVPIGPAFQAHRRTVRDVATARGRNARLVVLGGDVEVDTAIVEGVKDPLGHMVRNAVDHGIESPEERTAAGKDPAGTVTLRAFQDGGGIVVQVSDDGRGIDRARVARQAAQLGLVPDASGVADKDVARLLLEPGFSTSEEVTAFSGRGVGLDVVRRNVEALRGSVELETTPGKGTTVTLRLPLTLAIIQGFRVEVAGDVYVLPLDAVAECLDRPAAEARDASAGEGIVELRGHPLPFLRLRRLLALDGPTARRESIVVVGQGEHRAGLVVDALLGESQVVVKPLGRALRGMPCISGSSILGDGRVALILDVPGLMRLALRRAAESSPSPPAGTRPMIQEERP